MTSVNQTLNERNDRYGTFVEHAEISQHLKAVMQDTPNWDELAPFQKEALEMVVHKIARILNGDPNYSDSWHDIAGYAVLAENAVVDGEDDEAPEAPEKAQREVAEAVRLEVPSTAEDRVNVAPVAEVEPEPATPAPSGGSILDGMNNN
jgi:hypothetical protein